MTALIWLRITQVNLHLLVHGARHHHAHQSLDVQVLLLLAALKTSESSNTARFHEVKPRAKPARYDVPTLALHCDGELNLMPRFLLHWKDPLDALLADLVQAELAQLALQLRPVLVQDQQDKQDV